jgi:hypothetical protein
MGVPRLTRHRSSLSSLESMASPLQSHTAKAIPQPVPASER